MTLWTKLKTVSSGLLLLAALAGEAPAQTWLQLFPTPDPTYGSPSLRILNSTVYNTATKRLIVFGGGAGPGGYGIQNDVWVLTNADGLGGTASWIRLEPVGGPPGPREAHAAVYDQINNRMIIHGGYITPGNCGGVVSDVWVLSNADGTGGTPTWTVLSPSVPLGHSAPARRFHGAAYDQVNNRLIINGGAPSGCGSGVNDTWVLSNANGLGGPPAWSRLAPSMPADFPSDTSGGNTGYDPATNTFIRSIDQPCCSGVASTWVLANGNGLGGPAAWSKLPVTQTPTMHTWVNGGGVYDPIANVLAFIGGPAGGASEAWTLANANGSGPAEWTQLNPIGVLPDARGFSFVGYAAASNRLTMYGGSKDFNTAANGTNEVWVLTDAIEAPETDPTTPADKNACKGNGWRSVTRSDGSAFKNQGDCIQFVNTGK